MKTRRTTSFACAAGLALGATLLPHASHAQSLSSRTQLTLQANIVDFTKTTFEATDSWGDKEEVESSQLRFGLPQGGDLGLGYAVTDHFQLHASVGFDRIKDSGQGWETSANRFRLTPGVRFMTGGDAARLFLGVGPRFERGSRASSTDDGGSEDTVEGTYSAIGFAGTLGVYAFATDRVSIDPSIQLAYLSVTDTTEVDGEDIEVESNGLRVVLSIAVTGWLGGKARPPRPETNMEREALLEAQAPAREAPLPRSTLHPAPRSVQVHVSLVGMGLGLKGDADREPSRMLLQVEHLAAKLQWKECELALVGAGEERIVLASHYANVDDESLGVEERLRALVPARDLARWLAADPNPELELCGKRTPLTSSQRSRLQAAVKRFMDLSPEAARAPEPEQAPAAAPTEAPVQSGTEGATDTATPAP
jgi:hypothetical protein